MFDDIPPRTVGMLAAQHLGKTMASNPMVKDPAGKLTHKEPGHPWQEWRNGFIDTRILLHKQNRRHLALGVGILEAWRADPIQTRGMLIALGSKQGETLCLIVLAAMLEAEETRYDLDSPEHVLTIFCAMKQRMTNRPAHCYHEESVELCERAHSVAGALMNLFTQPEKGSVTLDVTALVNLMNMLEKMDTEIRDQIASGKFKHDDHSDQ